MRLKVIACDALRREICAAAATSRHRADLEFLPNDHADGPELLARVQEAVDRAAEAQYDAIVLAYALCGNGVAGLQSRTTQLVIPRANDCIGFLTGGAGICFRSTGWTERGGKPENPAVRVVRGDDAAIADYVTYRQLTYITTAPGSEPADRRAAGAFHTVRSDLRVFERLLGGEWLDAEVLVVPPGWRVRELPDGGIDREPIA